MERPEDIGHSAAAEAASVRWSEEHPDDELEHAPPAAPPELGDEVPNRHSASAEAAAERLREHEEG